jgi:hypothetical protein
VEISVWDSDPSLPVPQATDPNRVGKHGLEIVMAVCRTFEIRREPVGKRVKTARRLRRPTPNRTRARSDPRPESSLPSRRTPASHGRGHDASHETLA